MAGRPGGSKKTGPKALCKTCGERQGGSQRPGVGKVPDQTSSIRSQSGAAIIAPRSDNGRTGEECRFDGREDPFAAVHCSETGSVADQQRPLADALPPGLAVIETISMALKMAGKVGGKFSARDEKRPEIFEMASEILPIAPPEADI